MPVANGFCQTKGAVQIAKPMFAVDREDSARGPVARFGKGPKDTSRLCVLSPLPEIQRTYQGCPSRSLLHRVVKGEQKTGEGKTVIPVVIAHGEEPLLLALPKEAEPGVGSLASRKIVDPVDPEYSSLKGG